MALLLIAGITLARRPAAEMLPQQTLMLQIAVEALDDTKSRPADGLTTGVYVGIALDPNTTNYHLRWSCLAATRSGAIPTADLASPPLTANRTMGALGSIAASRIARAFHFGGPSHTVCSEEGSAARAVELAVRALQAAEIDRAVVGEQEHRRDRYRGRAGFQRIDRMLQ